jgi:HEAT repeat protein
MGLFGPPDVEKMKANRDVHGLIKALAYEKDYHIRADAALALGELKDANAVEPLIAVLKEDVSMVQQPAASALGKIKDARAVGPLIDSLKKTIIADEAIIALGEIGSPAIEQLRKMGNALPLRSSIKSKKEIELLGDIGSDRAVELLFEATSDKRVDWELKKAIFGILGQIGSKRAIQCLIELLKQHGSPEVVAALDKAGWQPGKDEIGALYWINKKDWEKCVEIGAPAVESLAEFGHHSFDKKDNKSVIWALGEIGEPGSTHLFWWLGGDNDKEAVEALDKTGWKPGKDEYAVRYWLAKGDWEKCAEIGAPAIKPLMDNINKNGTENALVKIGKPAVETLITNLGNSEKIAWILGEIGDDRAVEPLINVFKKGWGVRNEIRYKAAIQALVKIGAAAVEPLLAALNDPDARLRWNSTKALIGLYQSGKLDEISKNLILEHRGEISAPHDDFGTENCGAGHYDQAAIDFPL